MFHGQKDLIGIKQLSRQQIEEILDVAKTMKFIINQPTKRTVYLQGKSIVTLFCENSTRTKLSFESAVKYMGGMAGGLATSTSSTQKGESLLDTVKTINQMGTNCVIIRHSMSGTPEFIGKNVDACIINAGDGMNEHPTQALLDMFTIMDPSIGASYALFTLFLFFYYVQRCKTYYCNNRGNNDNIGHKETLPLKLILLLPWLF